MGDIVMSRVRGVEFKPAVAQIYRLVLFPCCFLARCNMQRGGRGGVENRLPRVRSFRILFDGQYFWRHIKYRAFEWWGPSMVERLFPKRLKHERVREENYPVDSFQ
ncbi:hypothetical protein JTE90_023196 [Oedothorax gibbosus]|uniref:Uncharacterized protein n=1 Tax=Oedothorax gibbosus TaxID=931172 RepID=A0AAV6TEQ7_9ARAC|nr:hypothetical protein JTE90_023196 [Oedothorax gibbosus]